MTKLFGVFYEKEDLQFANFGNICLNMWIQKSLFWEFHIYTMSNCFLIQIILVASVYSGEFFDYKLCPKTFFQGDQKWKKPPIWAKIGYS